MPELLLAVAPTLVFVANLTDSQPTEQYNENGAEVAILVAVIVGVVNELVKMYGNRFKARKAITQEVQKVTPTIPASFTAYEVIQHQINDIDDELDDMKNQLSEQKEQINGLTEKIDNLIELSKKPSKLDVNVHFVDKEEKK